MRISNYFVNTVRENFNAEWQNETPDNFRSPAVKEGGERIMPNKCWILPLNFRSLSHQKYDYIHFFQEIKQDNEVNGKKISSKLNVYIS